ncbi:MAG TPA: hypothetical protein DEF34_02805 [Desulfotomaculum sp.]|nr:MAG: hypothetical protein VR67_14615 [Peptococcaceae bacterium BRH_c8a]KJS77618.1 MAG: hypothetical protein JL56_02430 [Desulfotomaculum sp. BICA1-6]HBX22557.1 hypothetical protein [Desulfotomaculum sp.]
MAFELYVPRKSGDNLVAITKHHIRIGNRLMDMLDADHVQVAYDKATNKLRIQGVNEGGMKIGKNKVGAKGIFNYFGLEGLKGSFASEFNEKEKAVYVDLNSRK